MLKPIPGFPGYSVDSLGNVYSTRPKNGRGKLTNTPRKLRLSKRQSYNAIGIRRDGKYFLKNVSVLVLLSFVGPRPKGYFACHGPKGKSVDSLDNLYWATPKQNCLDKERDGTKLFGERHPRSRFNELQIRVIRKLYAMGKDVGISQQDIANIFETKQSSVANILYRNVWKHVV